MKKFLNLALFYFSTLLSFHGTIRLARRITPIFELEFSALSAMSLNILKIVQIFVGLFFMFLGLSFMSKGFKRNFPFLIFEEDIFEHTKGWIARGMLLGFFSTIGYYLLGLTN